MTTEITFYGVRGSSPISGTEYIKYGGNTASITIRTPSNSLIFLDAGTGIRVAEQELEVVASRVYLMISHTHADHVQGLGMTQLPFLDDHPHYKKKLRLVGSKGLIEGLSKFYDGQFIWPVPFTADKKVKPRMTGIDYDSIYEVDAIGVSSPYRIDDSTMATMRKGNHPVEGGVILYRFRIETETGPKHVVYATDNEFDYLPNKSANPHADTYRSHYQEFIQNADILIADAQYTKEDYYSNFTGFGHSHHEQIISIAEASNVKTIYLTHHHKYSDTYLDEINQRIRDYVVEQKFAIDVQLAYEGLNVKL